MREKWVLLVRLSRNLNLINSETGQNAIETQKVNVPTPWKCVHERNPVANDEKKTKLEYRTRY